MITATTHAHLRPSRRLSPKPYMQTRKSNAGRRRYHPARYVSPSRTRKMDLRDSRVWLTNEGLIKTKGITAKTKVATKMPRGRWSAISRSLSMLR
jgi:hypothetical protein